MRKNQRDEEMELYKLKFLRLFMNARGMKCHPYLIRMYCPLSKRMGRADEPTVCTSPINMKHILDGQTGTASSESRSYPRTLSKHQLAVGYSHFP